MIWNVCKKLFLVFVLIFLYLPILLLSVYSFTSATNIGAIRGFSLHNYVTLFTTPVIYLFFDRYAGRLKGRREGGAAGGEQTA